MIIMSDYTTRITASLTLFAFSIVHEICIAEDVDYIYMGNGKTLPQPNFDFWLKPDDEDSITKLITTLEDLAIEWNVCSCIVKTKLLACYST